jgi:hypothetical protein
MAKNMMTPPPLPPVQLQRELLRILPRRGLERVRLEPRQVTKNPRFFQKYKPGGPQASRLFILSRPSLFEPNPRKDSKTTPLA